MIWNYGFTKDETFVCGRFNEEYVTRCGLLTCVTSGGDFKAGEKYPFYCRGGYFYIVAIDLMNHKSTVYNLDAYYGDIYKIIGESADLEAAVFKEVM